MKSKVTTHDHPSASLEAVEKAAIERMNDVPVRDTELECAKYRRVMALEAELDAWKLRYERMKASYNAVSVERDNLCEEKEAMILGLNVSNERLQKDLQVMSASWKAVSVERDNLEGCIMQREQQIKSCENALIESREKCKTQQVLIDLRDAQIALRKNAATIAERESKRLIDKAKSQRNACQAVAFFAVVCMILIAFGGVA